MEVVQETETAQECIKKSIIVLFIACLMWSCNRNELNIEPTNVSNSSVSVRSELSINHSAGILHNRGLDSMFANCTPITWTPESLVSCSEIVAEQLGLNCSYLFDTLHINDSIELWLDHLYTSVVLGDFIIKSIKQSLIMLDSCGLNNFGILDTFVDMIVNDTYDFEALYEISVNSSYNWPTREGMEAFLGILAYSAIYWEEDNDVTDH